MSLDPVVLASLHDHARRSTFGDYPKRYAAVLEFAFRQHALILNAKQLREITGGGSQTTAQAAIDDFRQLLHRKLGQRVDLGRDLPEELTGPVTAMVQTLWDAAIVAAGQAYGQERESFKREIAAGDTARAELTRRMQAAESAHASVLQQNQDLNQELGSLRAKEQASAALAQALGAEKATQLAKVSELTAALEREQRELQDERRRSAETSDRLIREHREQLAAQRRDHAAETARLVADRDAAANARDQARAERVDADIARARAEQRASDADRQLAASNQRLEQLGTELEQAREERRATQAEASAARAQAQAAAERGAAYSAVLAWLAAGANPAFTGLSGIEVELAKPLLSVVRTAAAVKEDASGDARPGRGRKRES